MLQKGGNFEHRNVSDYTPLSLAASGGYVSIMKALLKAGADVNSRWAGRVECGQGRWEDGLAWLHGHMTVT